MTTVASAQTDWSDAQKVYEDRLATFFKDPGNFPYAPMEPLAGVDRWTPLPLVTPAQRSISEKALVESRSYAEAMNSTAFIVWRNGRIESEWYGKGVDARTPLVSRSLSKPLTAIAIGRAMAIGKIRSLDQSIAEFIPSARGTAKAKITVRYLLDMRSGMLDQGFSADPAHPYNLDLLDTEFGKKIIDSYPMPYEPGTRYSYANAPSDLVAMVIEGATGMRYGDFLSSEVLKPLGARRTYLGRQAERPRPFGLLHVFAG